MEYTWIGRKGERLLNEIMDNPKGTPSGKQRGITDWMKCLKLEEKRAREQGKLELAKEIHTMHFLCSCALDELEA